MSSVLDHIPMYFALYSLRITELGLPVVRTTMIQGFHIHEVVTVRFHVIFVNRNGE